MQVQNFDLLQISAQKQLLELKEQQLLSRDERIKKLEEMNAKAKENLKGHKEVIENLQKDKKKREQDQKAAEVLLINDII